MGLPSHGFIPFENESAAYSGFALQTQGIFAAQAPLGASHKLGRAVALANIFRMLELEETRKK